MDLAEELLDEIGNTYDIHTEKALSLDKVENNSRKSTNLEDKLDLNLIKTKLNNDTTVKYNVGNFSQPNKSTTENKRDAVEHATEPPWYGFNDILRENEVKNKQHIKKNFTVKANDIGDNCLFTR